MLNEISEYSAIIIGSLVIICSFFLGEISKRTSIPSVLLLIILGILVNLGMIYSGYENVDFLPILKVLGTVGLTMIVLEAALELKLDRDKLVPIGKAFMIALVGLLVSTWLTAEVLKYFIEGMTGIKAWLYATPLSILSSAIIIPSVVDLVTEKKEFHIYESTFSDILGIMLYIYLEGQVKHTGDHGGHGGGFGNFMLMTLLTIVVAFVVSYVIIFVFQRIRSQVKLFLLIGVLLLVYAFFKQMHLSSLLIILVFGLIIANVPLFFQGPFRQFIDKEKVHDIYHGLHVITMETAFVVRTFFFVIFGMTITFSTLADVRVAGISLILIAIIYVVRFVLLRASIGKDIIPQLYIAPRGLITILLFYKIIDIEEARVEAFNSGILLYVIIITSIIMTMSMIYDRRRANKAIRDAESIPVKDVKWKLPSGE